MNEVTRHFCWHQNFVPWGLSAPVLGLYTCIKSWKKNVQNQTSKIFFWNLQQMTKVTRCFCWHQNFVPKGLSAPAPGLYTCIKSWKKNVQNQTSKRFFWNLQQMTKVTRCFCWHQNFVPKGLSAPAPGLYTCIKSWKKMYKIRLQREFFETCNKWPKWQDVSVDIKISSPKGCQLLPRGYIHI